LGVICWPEAAFAEAEADGEAISVDASNGFEVVAQLQQLIGTGAAADQLA
jgi:hypothetical protein